MHVYIIHIDNYVLYIHTAFNFKMQAFGVLSAPCQGQPACGRPIRKRRGNQDEVCDVSLVYIYIYTQLVNFPFFRKHCEGFFRKIP